MDNTLEKRVLESMIANLDLDDVDVENFDFDASIFRADEEDEDGLNLDSVDVLELVVTLHQDFGLKVELEDMSNLRTVRDIANYIRENGADE